MARQRGNQRVAARAVDRPRAAQVAVELAALEEVRQRELLDDGRAEVVRAFAAAIAAISGSGTHQPAQA